VTYDSGVGAVIDVFSSQLSIQVTSSLSYLNNTVGLLGVNNNDINDDFTRPDGSKIAINSTQEQIYYQFGKLWSVNGSNSLFSLPDPDFDPSFVPVFFDDINRIFGNNTELKNKSIALCGEKNFQCLFDYALTGDRQAVMESQSSLKDFEAEEKILRTFPPTVQGPNSFTVTYQQPYKFQIMASSNNSGTLKYSIEANGTEPVVDPATGNVTLFINSTDFRLKYVVTDSNNNSASLSPTVTLCNCQNGGTCNPSTANTLFDSTNNLLIYGQCTCPSGFEGAFCQSAISYCSQYPCFEGVICTDNYTSHTAVCGPCPAGLIGDGSKCYDFDECVNKTAECNQICTNVLGSYNCSCNSGYALQNRTYCADIDECAQATHGCHINATCTNNAGSYSCACNNEYIGNGTACRLATISPFSTILTSIAVSSTTTTQPSVEPATSATAPTESCKNKQCKNGGLCAMNNGQEKCTCPLGLTGAICETQLHTIRGSITLPSISLNGRSVDLTSKRTRDDLKNSNSDLYIDLINLFQPELYQNLKKVKPSIDNVTVISFSIGSLIVDFKVSFTTPLTEALNELQKIFINAINGSRIGEVEHLQLIDYDECSTNKYCHQHANCLNIFASFVCSCEDGYTGNGFVCEKKETGSGALALGIILGTIVLSLLLVVALLIKKKKTRVVPLSNRNGFQQQ